MKAKIGKGLQLLKSIVTSHKKANIYFLRISPKPKFVNESTLSYIETYLVKIGSRNRKTMLSNQAFLPGHQIASII